MMVLKQSLIRVYLCPSVVLNLQPNFLNVETTDEHG